MSEKRFERFNQNLFILTAKSAIYATNVTVPTTCMTSNTNSQGNCLFSERELCQRRALREAGIKHVEKMSTFDDSVSVRKTYALDDEDNRCTVSNKICYLSMVSVQM